MTDHYAARRDRLLDQLRREELGGILVTNPVNVTYLTGFTGDSSFLLLSAQTTCLISDGRFTTQIEEDCPGLAYHIRPPAQTIQEAAGAILGKLRQTSVAVDSGHLTLADFESLAGCCATVFWKPERGRVEQMRAVKDAWEIEQIQAAIGMAERAFTMFRAMLRGGDTEKELTDAMEFYLRRAGARCASFPTIVAAGARAALPHAPPTDRRADEADLLLVDWGAAGVLYKSDLTRVLLKRKKATSSVASAADRAGLELRQVYEIVLNAQRQAIAAVRPGATAAAVDAAARSVIAEAGHGAHFNHSVGHGIGLQVHEMPLMRPGSQIELQAGMVVTVEPGIYVPGWGGIRIEDDVLVTPDGCQVLTTVSRDFESQWVEF